MPSFLKACEKSSAKTELFRITRHYMGHRKRFLHLSTILCSFPPRNESDTKSASLSL